MNSVDLLKKVVDLKISKEKLISDFEKSIINCVIEKLHLPTYYGTDQYNSEFSDKHQALHTNYDINDVELTLQQAKDVAALELNGNKLGLNKVIENRFEQIEQQNKEKRASFAHFFEKDTRFTVKDLIETCNARVNQIYNVSKFLNLIDPIWFNKAFSGRDLDNNFFINEVKPTLNSVGIDKIFIVDINAIRDFLALDKGFNEKRNEIYKLVFNNLDCDEELLCLLKKNIEQAEETTVQQKEKFSIGF